MHTLYSFRRCPYAMRARLAIKCADIRVELREVVLRDKPEAMLALSPKGTVPVLQLEDGRLLEESLDIALWALGENDPLGLLPKEEARLNEALSLIVVNDGPFKHHLDRTKYGTRYPDEDPAEHRAAASAHLMQLNERLAKTPWLLGARMTIADITIAPFVRQFANIDRSWFNAEPWPHLITWLERFLASELFQSVMQKYPQWREGDAPTFFPSE